MIFSDSIARADRRDALRLGVQSAVSAAVFFLLMRALGLPEVFVGVLSAVLILSESSDGSIGLGIDRVVATAFGSVVGVICLLALPYGWGTVTALVITMFVINAVSVLRPGWRYGVVAAVALSLGAEANAVEVSLERGQSIVLGVLVGILVSFVVWPERAATRYRRHRDAALRALRDRLEQISTASEKRVSPVSGKADQAYHDAFGKAVEASKSKRLGGAQTSKDELRHLRRVYNSVVLLDRALEDGWNANHDAHETLDRARDALNDLLEGRNPELPRADDEVLVPEDIPDAAERNRRAALAFGIRELCTEVRALADAMLDVESSQSDQTALAAA